MKMIRYCFSICFLVWLFVAVPAYSGFAAVCSNPGADGPANISGIVNTYYPGSGTASAGSTSVTVGTLDARGSATAVAAGNLVLLIQMQDADINSTNTSSYGGSTTGAGYTSLNNAGMYEYVVVSSVAGSTFTMAAPLQNSYRTAAATGTTGQRSFQVIRVPQYSSATLTGTVTAPPWDGGSGGVVAIDIGGNLAWGGQTIDVSGRGFRAGAARQLAGGAGANIDYCTAATINANGGKGEGIAGTPRWMFIPTTPNNNSAGANLDTGVEGYPSGSHARGAPGNAGGGGTDGNPAANDQNTGGGGGGAYSVGGSGGYGWTPGTPPGSMTGGFGGYSVPMGPGLLTMGGGGGAGSTNNATGTPAAGLASSGAAGGGIVIVRARTITGSGTVSANGTNANNTVLNDASGGGGAGGAILVFASNNSGSLGTLTVNARGGNGGTNTGGGSPHGPGGGGSGGFVAMTTATSVTINVQAGANGTTATSATSTAEYGSTASSGGYQIYTLQPVDIPGAGSNALCSPLLTVSKSTGKAETVQGGTTRYTLTVTNQSGYGAATGVTLTDALPSPFNLASTDSVTMTGGTTRTVTTNPVAGATTPSWSSFSIPGGGSVTIAYTVNVPVGAALGTYQNPGSVTYDDPTRTAAGQTATPGGTYVGGGTVPGNNYSSASSTQEDVTVWAPSTLSKSFLPASITPGGTSTLSIIITNSNSVPLNNAAFTDSYPAGLTNTATPNGTITGSGCFGAVTAANGGSSVALSGGVIPAGGSCTISVNVTFAIANNYTNTIPTGALTNIRNITNTAPASATLNQAAIQAPSVTKTFTPSQIQQGAISTLTLTVTNGGTTNLTGIAFTDNLTNMLVATPSVTTNSCGGTLTATAGSAAITLASGALNAGLSCSITVQITSNTISGAGGHTNTVTGITSSQSGAGPNSNTTYLVVAGTPTIAKGFAPATIAPGGSSTLTFTISNPGNIPLTNATFSDSMGNLKIAATAPAGGSCGGAASNTLNAGISNIVLTGLTIPATGSCTVTVQVTSTVSGAQTNIANGVSSTETPTPGAQSAPAVLTVLFSPQIAKSFAGMIQTGVAASFSTLTIIVTNPNSGTALTNVSFTDNLTNMTVYTTPTITNNCGGTVTATAGSAVVTLTGGNLAASGTCTVTVRIGSSTPSPAGGHANTINGATSAETGAVAGPPDTAYLNVLQAPTIAKAFSPPSIATGGTSTLVFTLTNPNSIQLTGGAFTDNFQTNLTTTNGNQNYIGVGRGTCVGVIPSAQSTTSTPAPPYTSRTFSGITIPANGSCTIMVDVTSSTAGNYSNVTGACPCTGGIPNTPSGLTTVQTPTAGPASNIATLSVGRVGISKTFSQTTIAAGGTSDITFTIDNDSGAIRTFTLRDNTTNAPSAWPVGMTVAAPIPKSNSCGGTLMNGGNSAALTAANSVSGFQLVTGSVPNSSTCTLVLTVTAAAAGTYTNQTSGIVYTGGPGPVSNTATLTVLNRPTIAKSFSPSTVDVYTTSTMTFTLTNPNSTPLTSAFFSDTLTGFSVAAPATIGGTCAGATNAPVLIAGATSLNITVPNLLPGSCTISIPVSSTTAGTYTNSTSGITTPQTGATAGATSNTATLTVTLLPLQVNKSSIFVTASPGTLVSYDIVYGNSNATTQLQNVIITDQVPVYTSYNSATCGSLPPGITSCSVNYTPPPSGLGNGSVSWTLGGILSAGSSGTVQLTVRIQ
jgi:uncharacterized repeat protein (TIGR01451 family)